MDKTLITSKVFWIACIQALVGIAIAFNTAYPTVGGLIIAKSILDVILRFLTTAPLGGIIRKK